ncbi:MAG TPA: sigma-70 family RNA polymerase sigma factor [Streptosporangiaceae bacterium]|jgi:RNA polymerase sigma-B factor
MAPSPVAAAAFLPAIFAGAPAGEIRGDLAGLDDGELLRIAGSLPRHGERRAAACDLLVSRHRHLVMLCARRYRRGSEPDEELMQVGYVGLMKAINSFNPAFGGSLAAYAQPTIAGEMKRHFRDKGWPVHVKRSAQELVLEVRAATGQLAQELGRAPVESDLARYLGVSGEAVRDAQVAEMAFATSSLDAPVAGQPTGARLTELLGGEDRRFEHLLNMQAVATHWDGLPARERAILLLRFNGDLTQAEIGRQLGISQMQVSRLLSHAFGYLRACLLGPEPPGFPAGLDR